MRTNTLRNILHSPIIWGLCLTLVIGLLSCGKDVGSGTDGVTNLEYMYVRDLTMSDTAQFKDTIAILWQILSTLGLEDKDAYTTQGIQVHFSYVGHISHYPVSTVTLPPGKHWLLENTRKRKNDIQDFKGDLYRAFHDWLSVKADQRKSKIYCGMAGQLADLTESEFAPTKLYFLYSDGLEADGTIRFENFTNNVAAFRDTIGAFSTYLESQCPMPEDLHNVHIKLIHTPKPYRDDLQREVNKFWEGTAINRGGDLKISAN